jgi:hypothetical protein
MTNFKSLSNIKEDIQLLYKEDIVSIQMSMKYHLSKRKSTINNHLIILTELYKLKVENSFMKEELT